MWHSTRWRKAVRTTLFVFLAASGLFGETIRIDANAPGREFPHFWERMFGSGRAILSLRESYRQDLRATKAVTDLEYVRFHAILDDEVGVLSVGQDGAAVYNFSYVDQIYDGLLANGVRPFVELSFMPKDLAASLVPHAFWYKPLPSPPKDYAKWGALVEAFTSHLRDRYGAEEVRQWYFEVWNEPNIDFWTGKPAQSTYWELYDAAARAVKKVDSRFRVGGPATAQAAWVPAFLEHCATAKVPVDFVSTHVYGNEKAEDVFGTHEAISQADMVGRSVKKVFAEVNGKMPIIWSEYNATYLNDMNVTDSAYMGPWLANNIRECDGMTEMMSYWTFSDVFEEQGVVNKPFYGGYGLIAAGSIPKPSFFALAMLHRLGDRRVDAGNGPELVTKRSDGTIAVAIWNYAGAGESGAEKEFQLEFTGLKGGARYQVEMLDDDHGSALKAWKAMGSPANPTREQTKELRSVKTDVTAGAVSGTLTVRLKGHGLALVEVK